MAGADPVWERFVACKLSQAPSFVSQNSENNSILGARSVNLTSGSIALNADAGTAGLMRDLAVKPVEEILSGKASQELASRDRYVDFVRLVLSCCVADASGREKKAAVAVKALQAIHSGLVVDKPAHELQNVLLTELDDINPDRVPLIADAILAPLLAASRRRGEPFVFGQRNQPPPKSIGDAAAAGFLVALDILPKVLGLTAGVPALSEEAPVPEDCRGLSGAQYKERVVSSLFRARWPGAVSIGMCQVLRDLDLEDGQLRVAVARVLRHLRKSAKLHDLPPLTYQLLLLAGRKCKEAALEGVIRVFDRLDAAAEAADREDAAAADDHIPMRRGSRLGASSTEELRLVEGTILLHFNFAMKQDHNLASCVLKGFQRRATAPEVGRAFTPFRLALLLSLSRIQRFSQPVLDLVQDIVSDCLMYDHLREGSAWLEGEEELVRWGRRDGGGSGGGGGTNRSRAEADEDGSDGEVGVGGGGSGGRGGAALASSAKVVESVLLTVVRSSRGWDHLVESLLKLGMQLLDRGGAVPAGAPLAAGVTKGMLEKLQGSHSHRASLRASHLGRVVLMETFKTHEIVRRKVLTSVLEQVTARSHGVMGYVKLLGLLAERSPNLLLDEAEAVRDVFGYISILPPPVAERFLLAVAPLLRLRPRLQDSVVLPLRKALFSREEHARLVAVGGLVLLLGIQSRSAGAGDARRGAGMHGGTQLSQSSQASQGWSSASLPAAGGTGGSGRALSLAEGFGLLRRCLTQQMVVRAKLYDGLLASFVRGSLEFQLDTISILVGHLRRFVNLAAAAEGSGGSGSGAGGGPPLLLARCLDQPTGDIAEPLPLLIGCLHRMVVLGRASLAEHAGSSSDGGRADPDSMLDDDVDGQRGAGAAATAAGMALLESLEELDGDLRRLSTALSGAALEDFGLDKVADFSPAGGPAARAKLATAALLCGSYEAFMQGSLLLMGRPANEGAAAAAAAAVAPPRRRPTSASLRALSGLFDCRQALLELVRPGLPTPAQQRAKKSSSAGASGSGGGSSGSVGGSLGGDGESAGGAGGGATGSSGPGQPGFSALGCFGLTLHPRGMPCLGMAFVEDMLAVLNVEPEKGDNGEETEGDTECDPGVVDVDARDDSTDAVREDLGLQRLVLETCRGHLRSLRTSTAAATAGLMVEIGGICSAKGAVSASSAASGIQGGPQDEADAARAGKAAVKRCTGLVPLLLKEVFRQLAEGNNSGEAKAAAAAMKTSDTNGSKGKGKGSSGGAVGGGSKGKKKSGRSSAPAESLSELALACFEECVCIVAHCSPRARAGASRTGKFLAAAYKNVSGSNAPPADPAGVAGATSVIGKHAGALVQTLTALIADNQGKEAETVCRVLSQLARPLRLEPECLEVYAASLKLVCREQRVNSPVLAKAVVSLYVQAQMSIKAKDGNLNALHDLATQVRACLGLLEECEEEEDEPPALSFRIINNYTVASISEVTVGAIEACIDDVEYALRLMHKASLARQARVAAQTPEGLSSSFRHWGGAKCSQSDGTVSEDGLSSDGSLGMDRTSDSDSDAAGVRSDGSSGERDPLDRRETVVCDRLRVVMQTISVLAGTRLEGRSMEKLVSSASRVFRTIIKVLKVRLSLKRAYVGLGLKSVLVSKQDFTKALHSLLPHLEDEKGSKVTKNNITRQSRLVPALIFQMEECDVQLLLLGKLCKGSLDLPRWVSSRVDRDFRIDQTAIAGCQEKSRGLREKRKRKGKAGSSSASKKKSSAQAKKNKAAEDGSEREGGEGDGDKDGEDEEEEEEEEGEGENADDEEEDDEEEEGEEEEEEEGQGGGSG